MRDILLIKMTSLGDIIHTLPAITDATKQHPDLQFHWLVEAPFAEITTWHPHVTRAIPSQLRKWRKALFEKTTWQAWRHLKKQIRTIDYDAIIDAQGLIKSAYLTRLGRGRRHGFGKHCAREPLAARFYHDAHEVDPAQHAITRTRELFSRVFAYSLESLPLDYGLDKSFFPALTGVTQPYVIFLHGTTWATKHWPDHYWRELADMTTQHQTNIQLLWGNADEQRRAEEIARINPQRITVQPKLTLTQAAGVIAHAQAIVAVDTGLGHLAAALGTPTISLYGPTDPRRTGTVGNRQIHLAANHPSCAPCLARECFYPEKSDAQPACFAAITPAKVWQALQKQLGSNII